MQGTNGEREIHVGQLSYFSQLADASTFTELAAVEMRRRKVTEAKAVCAVTDGADWCQTFSQRYRPDAVRILDFPHAAEHLSRLLEVLEQAGLRLPEKGLERSLHILKHRGPRPLLRSLSRLPPALAQQKGIQEQVDYLQKRESLMGVTHLSRPGVAYWVRDGGECQQKRGPSPPQGAWDAT